MTTPEILIGVVLGLVVNECCDVSPWLARKLVRWSARGRYRNPRRAEIRAEELIGLIDVRPGKLFKLITALVFVITAAAVLLGRCVSDRAPGKNKRDGKTREDVPPLAADLPAVSAGFGQSDRGAAMRRRLLDATVDNLVRYGYAGTTTTRVTELAGVTGGVQAHHFPTRAGLVAAAVRHVAAKRAELAFEKMDTIRQAPDLLEAGLDLMWEIHQGPVMYATIEMWVAARTDPELREQLAKVEPAARVSLMEFAEAAFGEYARNPRFRHVMFTAMDTIRGILLMGLADEDFMAMNKRWRRARRDLLDLMAAVLRTDDDDSV